eukprot:TRINITY_DN12142_c0_g2_i16.p1 TRINITY_DN12142_c0_g2~~TRINITY_DN12142_c0_g2_i16.p1  ORF type:complete len:179 (+),score=44.50 TRINITY_DN12142_c0_g2_i16:335-871(+)
MAPELLQEDYTHLMASDIFSLGCTMYEAASGIPLAKNGPEWQAMRNGQASRLARYSNLFNELLFALLQPNPEARPSIDEVVGHPVLQPEPKADEGKDSEELRKMLIAERTRNMLMARYDGVHAQSLALQTCSVLMPADWSCTAGSSTLTATTAQQRRHPIVVNGSDAKGPAPSDCDRS